LRIKLRRLGIERSKGNSRWRGVNREKRMVEIEFRA
jgi:hypothetical protein